MEIYITWAHIIVALTFYLIFKYARSCYLKVYHACDSPFNPFIPYESLETGPQWKRGYCYGRKNKKLRHRRELQQMFTEELKEINDLLQDLVEKAEQDQGIHPN